MDFQYIEEPEYPFFNDLKKCITRFVNLAIALLISFVLFRVLELGFITNQNSIPQDIEKVIGISLLYDVIFLLKILPLLFIPYVLVFFNTKNKTYIFIAFGVCTKCAGRH